MTIAAISKPSFESAVASFDTLCNEKIDRLESQLKWGDLNKHATLTSLTSRLKDIHRVCKEAFDEMRKLCHEAITWQDSAEKRKLLKSLSEPELLKKLPVFYNFIGRKMKPKTVCTSDSRITFSTLSQSLVEVVRGSQVDEDLSTVIASVRNYVADLFQHFETQLGHIKSKMNRNMEYDLEVAALHGHLVRLDQCFTPPKKENSKSEEANKLNEDDSRNNPVLQLIAHREEYSILESLYTGNELNGVHMKFCVNRVFLCIGEHLKYINLFRKLLPVSFMSTNERSLLICEIESFLEGREKEENALNPMRVAIECGMSLPSLSITECDSVIPDLVYCGGEGIREWKLAFPKKTLSFNQAVAIRNIVLSRYLFTNIEANRNFLFTAMLVHGNTNMPKVVTDLICMNLPDDTTELSPEYRVDLYNACKEEERKQRTAKGETVVPFKPLRYMFAKD